MLIKSALRDWLSVSYGIISILVVSRYAAPPYPAAPDFLHGKACHTILRSLCSLTNRVPLPPHPGDRIKHSMLSCRDMAPWLSIHSAPACGGKVVAPATKGGIAEMACSTYDSFLHVPTPSTAYAVPLPLQAGGGKFKVHVVPLRPGGKRLTWFSGRFAPLHPLLSLTHWIFGSLCSPTNPVR